VYSSGIKVYNSGFRILGSGISSGHRVQGLESDLGFRV
jgi:hypothetical protein